MGLTWREALAPVLAGRVVVLALGDREAGDDAAGVLVAERLRATGYPWVVDCGSYPQHYGSVLARLDPDAVVVVDAMEAGLEPGEIKVMTSSDVTTWGSTHGLPLSAFMDYLEALTHAPVRVVGIQVSGLGRGVPVHPQVVNAAAQVADFLASCVPPRGQP